MKSKRKFKFLISSILIMLMMLESPAQALAEGLSSDTSNSTQDDYGNDFTGAQKIDKDIDLNGKINIPGDKDVFVFTAPNDGTYAIYTKGNMDTSGVLYDGQQQKIMENDDNGVDTNFLLNGNFKAGQSYYIEVSAHNINLIGTYTLRVELADTEAPGIPLNIVSTSTTSNSVSLSWDASTDNKSVEKYIILRDGKQAGISFSNKFNDSNLTPGQEYTYNIKAVDGQGNASGESAGSKFTTTPDLTSPSTVPYIEFSDSTSTSASMYWGDSSDNVGVKGYYIYRDGTKIADVLNCSYTDKGLTPETRYTYTIYAYDSSQNLSAPHTAAITTGSSSNDFPEENFDKPLNVTVDTDATGSAKNENCFKFTAPEDGNYYFKIDTTNCTSKIAMFDSNKMLENVDFENSSSENDLHYINSNYMKQGEVCYLLAEESIVEPNYYTNFQMRITKIRENLPKPTGLQASYNTNGSSINLSWDDIAEKNSSESYLILRDGIPVGTSSSNSYTDNRVVENRKYSYSVELMNYMGKTSQQSDIIDVTVINNVAITKPTGLAATYISSTKVGLTWNSSGSGTYGYKLYRDGVKIGDNLLYTNSFTDTNVNPNSSYTYTVKAFDGNGNITDIGDPLTVTTKDRGVGSSLSTATSIEAGTDVNAALEDYNDTDYFKFTPREDGDYDINVSNLYYKEIKLYEDDKLIKSSNANIKAVLSINHVYKVSVKSYYTNTYDLKISKEDSPQITAPANVAIAAGVTSAKLSWNGDHDFTTGFYVYRNGDKIKDEPNSSDGTTINFVDNNLTPETKYDYKIVAHDSLGNVSSESPISGTTLPASGQTVGNAEKLNLGSTLRESIYPEITCSAKYFSFTPQDSGIYKINCAGDSIAKDLEGCICDSDGNKVFGAIYNESYNSGKEGSCFYVNSYMESGQTYYIKLSTNVSGFTYNISVNKLTVNCQLQKAYVTSNSANIFYYFYSDNYQVNVNFKTYKIYRDGQLIKETADNSFTDTNLQPATSYVYKVKAVDEFGDTYDCANDLTVATYNDDYKDTISEAAEEALDNDISGAINGCTDKDAFSFTPTEDGNYCVYLNSNSVSGTIYDSNRNKISDINSILYTLNNSSLNYNYVIELGKLTANNKYYMVLDAGNNGPQDGAVQGYYFKIEKMSQTTVPSNLKVTSVNKRAATIAWDAVNSTDVVNYSIFKVDSEGNNVYIGETGLTSFNILGLEPDTDYSFKVTANYKNDEQIASEAVNVKTLSQDAAVTVYAPQGLACVDTTSSTASIFWLDYKNILPGGHYEIYRDGQFVGGTTSTPDYYGYADDGTFDYYDSGLEANKSYVYTVKAVDSSGNESDFSMPVTVTTCNDDYSDDFTTDTSLQMDTPITGDIDFSGDEDVFMFTPVNTDHYIFMSTGSTDVSAELYDDNYTMIASSDDASDSDINFNICTKLDAGNNYYLKVKHNTYGGTGSYNISVSEKDMTNPTAPENLSFNYLSASRVHFNWKASTDNAKVAGYEIYRDGVKISTTTEEIFTDSGLTPGQQYDYKIRAFDTSMNYSGFCTDIYVKPTLPSIDKIGPDEGTLLGGKSTSLTLAYSNLIDANNSKLEVEYSQNDTDFSKADVSLTNSSNQYKIVWNLDGIKSGNYVLRFTLSDDDNTPVVKTVNYNIDTTAPAAPTGLSTTSNDTAIFTTWYKPADTDLKSYNIYRKDSGSDYTLINSYNVLPDYSGITQDKKFIIIQYNPMYSDNKSYYLYTFSSSDSVITSGEIAENGCLHKVLMLSNTVLISSYELTDGEWKPNSSQNESKVAYIDDFQNPCAIDSNIDVINYDGSYYFYKNREYNNNNVYINSDRTAKQGTDYTYKVTAVDNFLQEGQASEEVTERLKSDITPPSIPQNIRQTSNTETSITLSWDASTDNMGVAGYNIYRDGEKVGTSLSTTFTDCGLTKESSYSYTVKAFDHSGNYSLGSIPELLSTFLPKISNVSPSENVEIGGKNQNFTISFNHVGAISIQDIKVEYSYDGVDFKTADGTMSYGKYDCSYTWDMSSLISGYYLIRFTLTDSCGNVSNVTKTYRVSNITPGTPKGLAAVPSVFDITLKWLKPNDLDLTDYYIYRSDNQDTGYEKIGEAEPNELSFIDKNVEVGKTYYYKICDKNVVGYTSDFSNIASAARISDTQPPEVVNITPSEGTVGNSISLTATVKDNYLLSSITLQYSLDGLTWNDLNTKDTTFSQDEVKYTMDTSNINGSFEIRAIAKDAAGNTSDGSLVRTYETCHTGPAKIENFKASAQTNSARLTWSDPNDDKVSYFSVEQKDPERGTYKEITQVKSTLGYDAQGLEANKTYYFRVTGVDIYGNRGVPSDEAVVKTQADDQAPCVKNISPSPGYYSDYIPLKADVVDNEAVESLTFQYSIDQSNWTDIVTLTPSSNDKECSFNYNFNVKNMSDQIFIVRGVAKDTSGNVSTMYDTPYITYAVDHTPPNTPTGFQTVQDSSAGHIKWSADESERLSYIIYRSMSADGPFEQIDKVTGVTEYKDYNVNRESVYYYKISAVDMANNGSTATDAVEFKLADDKELPAIGSIYPAAGSTLPKNPTLSLIVKDNDRVSKVKAEYRKKTDSEDAWQEISTRAINKREDIAEFTLDTAGLHDGAYVVRYTVTDVSNNAYVSDEIDYNLNVDPPSKVSVTAKAEGSSVTLSWTGGGESDISKFVILRKSAGDTDYKAVGKATDSTYTDSGLKPSTMYSYVVEAVDNCNNSSQSDEVTAETGKDTEAPKAYSISEITAMQDSAVIFDGSKSTDNGYISSYSWDFGDGQSDTGIQASHIYSQPGVYTATLTVYDGELNSNSQTIKVTVKDKSLYSTFHVKVIDDATANPLSGANVAVQNNDGTTENFVTDKDGYANVVEQLGDYKLFAYIDGYKPSQIEISFTQNTSQETVIRLVQGKLVDGKITVNRMTLPEIEAAGIDTTNPDNQWIYKFEVYLNVDSKPTEITLNSLGEDPFCGGGDIRTINILGLNDEPSKAVCEAIPSNQAGVAPTLLFLVIPGEAHWLKEFFQINLTMMNTSESGSEFDITDAAAKLNLPDGLTLAPTPKEQSLNLDLGTIKAGSQSDCSWIVRGDKEGSYTVGASFSGNLQPFNKEISAQFATVEPFTVFGTKALFMHVQSGDKCYAGIPFLVAFGFENKSTVPVHDFSFKISQGTNYILTPGEDQTSYVREIPPGETAWFYYTLIPTITGDIDLDYSFVKNLTDVKLDYDMSYIDSNLQDKLTAKMNDMLKTNAESQTVKKDLLKLNGALPIDFNLSYDSKNLKGGTLGKGWSHPYEAQLHKLDNGNIMIDWNANCHGMYYYDWGNTYTPVDEDNCKDKLFENTDGSYTLRRDDNTYCYFDKEGDLTEIGDNHGFKLKVTTNEFQNVTKVEEPISGQYINFEYNDKHFLDKVTDNMGRTVSFKYDDNDNLTKITDADGNPWIYTYNADGRVLSETDKEGRVSFKDTYDDLGRVTERNDGKYSSKYQYDTDYDDKTITTTITDRCGNTKKMVHDFAGRIIGGNDGNNNSSSIEYDDKGNVKQEGTNNTLKGQYEYDLKGNLITSTDEKGVVTRNLYDKNGNVTETDSPGGSKTLHTYDSKNNILSSTDADNNTTTYTYDDQGFMKTKTVPGYGTYTYNYTNGLLAEEIDPDGKKISYEYDAVGRVISKTDRDGNTSKYSYDNNDNVLQITSPKGSTEKCTYDSRNNKLTVTNALGKATNYSYNWRYKLDTVTDALGNKTSYGYDPEERQTTETDAKGNVSSQTYDADGNVMTETDKEGNIKSYTYDADGKVLTETNALGGVTSYTYEKGQLKTEKDPSGNVTTYEYDDKGRKSAEVNAAGGRKTYTYDDLGNLVSETDELGNTTKYTYDSQGKQLTQTDAKGNVAETDEYDCVGNCIKTIDALGNEITHEYDGKGREIKSTDVNGGTTSTEYDADGRAVKITDALGNAITMDYDAAGKMTVKKAEDGSTILTVKYDDLGRTVSQTDGLNRTTASSYDELGNLIESVDAKGQKGSLDYDKTGRLVQVIDALNGKAQETYDKLGDVKTYTDPTGNTVNYDYDANGNKVSESYTSGRKIGYTYNNLNQMDTEVNGRNQTMSYKYDSCGRELSFTTPEDTISYSYDQNGNLLTVTDKSGTIKREYDALDRVTSYTDAAGNKIGYSYDKVGNLTGLNYPNGKTVKYEYNADNKLTKVTDWAGRVTSYDYDVRGRLTATTRPDGSKEMLTYDNGNQLLTQTDTDKSGNSINKYNYSYDLNGNVTSEKNDFTDNMFVNRADGSKDMTYGADNRLMTYNGSSIQYDADGNMTNGPLKGNMINFTYDSQNQLTSAGSTTYGYDGDGNRTSITENQKTTKYVINPEASMSETLVRTDGDGKTTCYIYGLGLIGEEESDGSYLIYHFDRRGSTTALTDINGSVTDRFTYGPYGEMAEHKGSSTTPFMFNGKDGVMTDSNGLYYMRSRYYNPEIKRFINMDTVTGDINDAKTMNRFAYANGNPINMVDPFGTSALTDVVNQYVDTANSALEIMGDALGIVGMLSVLDPELLGFMAPIMEAYTLFDAIMDTMFAGLEQMIGEYKKAKTFVAKGLFSVANFGLCSLIPDEPNILNFNFNLNGEISIATAIDVRQAAAAGVGALIATGGTSYFDGGSSQETDEAEIDDKVLNRVEELKNSIPDAQKGRVTMATGVAKDSSGNEITIVSTSEPNGYLRKSITLKDGEILAKGNSTHAEVDIVNYCKTKNLKLISIGATRPVCPECVKAISTTYAKIVTPLK